MPADLQRAFRSLPLVTRTLLAGTACSTVPTLLDIISPYSIIFLPRAMRKGQLWPAGHAPLLRW